MANDDQDRTQTHIVLTPGTMVSHYKIVDKIGAGGMGEVYLADDTKLNRKVALKFMPMHLATDSEMRQRFTREAQAAARLDHPNIITIYEVGEFNGRPFFAMQYIEGETLNKFNNDRSLSLKKTIDLISQISSGLAKAHVLGIIHRDIKSSNIIVDRDSRAKILDFGLATLQGSEMLTKTGSTLGTVAYMSPEQVQGSRVDHRSDIFSLGVVMYELITGHLPFKRSNDAATLHSIVSDNPAPLNQHNPSTPPELERVVSKALAKNPTERYQSASEIVDDLNTVSQSFSSPGQSGGAIAAQKPSVAVLPFTNMSSDPDNEYFSDGITEEIISSLSLLQNLHVAARTSSFFFKNKSVEIREIGEKLQVEQVLEGSVRKMGNKLRISAQLINVADGYHLWSEKYDRTTDDIFAIQDEIAGSIAEKLKLTLSSSEKNALIKHGTENMQAYDLYLRGRFYWEQRGRKLTTSLSYFRRAIELDPNYALAYVALGDVYHMMGLYGIMEPVKCMPRAKEAALKALELEPDLAEAHTTLAMVSLLFDREWARARELFERCNELNPRYVRNRYWYAYWYIYLYAGKTEEALAESQRGIDIDPLAALPTIHYALILWMERRNDEVLALMEEIRKRDPIAYKSYWWLVACCLCDKGEYEQALSVCPPVEKSLNRHQWSVAFHGYILATAGKSDDAQLLQDELNRRFEKEYISNFTRAIIPMSLGDKKTTLDILSTTPVTRDCGIIIASRWPMFSPIHGDEEFIELIARENLKIDSIPD